MLVLDEFYRQLRKAVRVLKKDGINVTICVDEKFSKDVHDGFPSITFRDKNAPARPTKHFKLMEISLTPHGLEIGGIVDSPQRP